MRDEAKIHMKLTKCQLCGVPVTCEFSPRKYCKKCSKLKQKEHKLKWFHNNLGYCYQQSLSFRRKQFSEEPWRKTYSYIMRRCVYDTGGWYITHGITNTLSVDDLKFLWFRDKAYKLETPSVDRIDSKKGYSLDNCRYIEKRLNTRRSYL